MFVTVGKQLTALILSLSFSTGCAVKVITLEDFDESKPVVINREVIGTVLLQDGKMINSHQAIEHFNRPQMLTV